MNQLIKAALINVLPDTVYEPPGLRNVAPWLKGIARVTVSLPFNVTCGSTQ